ncbi:hypothetical protein COEREDRAFT_79015 [Coemansia reversa NRRL 1564]|uniref:Uncharacterized protein n=1 Tax=Coemansia reversa (strain ATCC 12441 / NRRL 1564) TaxID=763665 RepID=A0A2G5BL68_COERN|nr:hypothetical protein COEREDRAFT_79015 [Coemansia reversa NRRL 1564]|eukprot:PIA19731.1 hypothetical protein COEREDRAFT_79015 [Coemansia reversa NRRL 1564]
MGFLSTFYPDRKRDLRPKYRKHCNCNECVDRAHSYGQHWRHLTPVCTCCDCMALAGENVPHTHSTYEHTHAATHTCAMTGDIRHKSNPNTGCCSAPTHDSPPPKYSLKPNTSHKVDNCCGSRYYTTPLFPAKQPSVSNSQGHSCGAHHGYDNCPAQQSTHAHYGASLPHSTAAHAERELVFLTPPAGYRTCNHQYH